MQHRVDVLDEMAKIKLPGASVPHSLSAATTDGSGSNPLSAGINPLLLPLHHQISLTPCQRAQLVPHWRSFLSESRVLRQEMRAALVRVSTAPEALIATYQGAQASAEVRTPAPGLSLWLAGMRCSARDPAAPSLRAADAAVGDGSRGSASRNVLHPPAHDRQAGTSAVHGERLAAGRCTCAQQVSTWAHACTLAPFLPPQLLSTKQTAFLLLATQHHTLDPEQICKVLLGGGGDDGEGLPGGGDRGHVLAELATSSA
jgi:hypothetical protein